MKLFARVISTVFHPLLLATWIVVLFSNLNKYAFGAAPVGKMTLIVFFNTFFFPAITFLMLYLLNFIPDFKLDNKQDRTIPFIAVQVFYIWSFMAVKQMQMPVFMQLFVLGGAITIAVAFVANIFTRLSIHMAGMGAVFMLLILVVFTGAIDVGHIIPVVIILAGLMATARIIISGHTYSELYYGFLVGVLGQIGGLFLFTRLGFTV